MKANLTTGLARGAESGIDHLEQIENLTAEGRLVGNDGPNTLQSFFSSSIRGAGGDDVLLGAFTEMVRGGPGHDRLTGLNLHGGTGDDFLQGGNIGMFGGGDNDGGPGVDTIGFDGLPVVVDLTAGTALQLGPRQSPELLRSIENVNGTEVDDVITGDARSNLLAGGAGNDTIDARGGDDQLLGSAGDDNLAGGDNNDTLVGGEGIDRCDGGPGGDRTDTCETILNVP